jgi:hypothetical protein
MNKENPFEKGDIAICIDNGKNPSGHFDYKHKLTLGAEYEVFSALHSFGEQHITVKSDEGFHITPYAKRFKLKEKPMDTTKFKVGDMVIAKEGEELGIYGIYNGNEYEITNIFDPNENGSQTISVRGDKGFITPFYSTRFVKSNKNMKTKETKAFIIKTHNNPMLCQQYVKMAEDNKITKIGKRTETLPYIFVYDAMQFVQSPFINEGFDSTLPVFDGGKDFKEIEQEFKNLVNKQIKQPLVNGYYGKYNKGDTSIEFGCAKISASLVKEAFCLMKNAFLFGNRNVKSIVLDSGVVITKQQILEIQSYIDKINE